MNGRRSLPALALGLAAALVACSDGGGTTPDGGSIDAAANDARVTVTVVGIGVVRSTPAGIQCGNSFTRCSARFPIGSTVSFGNIPSVVTPTFLGWSGACTGTGPCGITVTGDLTVTATFGCVDDCAVGAAECVGDTGQRTCGQFDEDACRDWSTPTACTGEALCATATCGDGTQLSVLPLGEGATQADVGTITSSPAGISCGRAGNACQEVYPTGTTVTLTASSDATATFYGWSLLPLTGHTNGMHCVGSTAPCTVTLSEPAELAAEYCTPECTAGASRCVDLDTVETCGNFDEDPCQEWGPATACTGTNVCTASGCTAGFVVTATTTGDGDVAIDGVPCATVPCSRGVATGGSAQITATAEPHAVFSSWSGLCTGTAPCIARAAGTVTANFVNRCTETEDWLTGVVDELVLTPTHLYWSQVSDVWRSTLPPGPGAEYTPNANSRFVADGNTLFYVREAGFPYSIMRSDGATATALAEPATSSLPAFTATDVYYANSSAAANGGTVRRVPRSGGASVEVAAGLPYFWPEPVELLADATSVYWFGGGAVVKIPLAGGATTTLATGQDVILAVAQDATSLYWSSAGELRRVAKAGGAVTDVIAHANAQSVAVHGTTLAWVGGDTVPYRPFVTTIGSGVATPLTGVARAAGSIAIDANRVYYAGSHNGIISFIGTFARNARCAP